MKCIKKIKMLHPIFFGLSCVFFSNSLLFLCDFFLTKRIYNPITIEGIFLVFLFFFIIDYFHYIPNTFYNTEWTIETIKIVQFLSCFDFLQYWFHRCEHYLKIYFHRHHHSFHRPTVRESFIGHVQDTIFMILLPLFICMNLFPTNMYSFIVIGSIFSNHFLYIHNNWNTFFDKYLPRVGLMNAELHQKHHQYFNCNFGHLFIMYDYFFKTLQK